jgi:hypothetical protein
MPLEIPDEVRHDVNEGAKESKMNMGGHTLVQCNIIFGILNFTS